MKGDPTTDPGLRSWVPVPDGSDFPVQNLPYGVFRPPGGEPRVGVAIGEQVLDMAAVAEAGLLPEDAPAGLFRRDRLNAFMALGPGTWGPVRRRLSELLSDEAHRGAVEPALVPAEGVDLLLPFEVPDYVDFYSSLEHATNMGRMLRPGEEPLPPNWRHLPVGYHGRSGTVVVSGTPVVRPKGQVKPRDGDPVFRPSARLDAELEVGFVLGPGNRLGEPIPVSGAREHVFGLVLVNDWSARDVQGWEYQPLGPFLGKSFATSISPWVVTLDALEPYRVPGPRQEPPPLPYLAPGEDWAYDLRLEMALVPSEGPEQVVSRTNFRFMYWSIPQQLAHATANGALARPGDLYASGTVSGPSPGSYGSLLELTWAGTRPIVLPDGSTRTFLEDGDSVVIRGRCEGEGLARIGFGELRGTVLPASPG